MNGRRLTFYRQPLFDQRIHAFLSNADGVCKNFKVDRNPTESL
jgi:hypothetical protein